MATTKDVKRLPSGRLSYRGETFAGYNKPKKTPGKSKKSAVLAKKGKEVKLVRLATQTCRSKSHSRVVEVTLERVTTVIRQRINFPLGIGPVKLGDSHEVRGCFSEAKPA